MQQLTQNQVNQVTGGNFFGPMFTSIFSGMTEGEKALGLTCLGIGAGVGYFVGQWGMIGIAAGTIGYIGWDWYSSGDAAEASEA